MEKIPDDVLKVILALRRENGLEATESALNSDLSKSRAKWSLEATPRYRRAGRSPLYVSGKYLSSTGKDPATGEPDGQATEAPAVPAANSGELSGTAFYKALHQRGFAVKHSQNLLTGELETKLPPELADLDFKFSVIPANPTGIHVTQTSQKMLVTMPLDIFLKTAGIEPGS